MSAKPTAHVIVGVLPGQPDAVVLEAATFAQRFDAELVCAHVDVDRYMIFDMGDGSMTSFPVDPDLLEPADATFDPALLEHLTTVLGDLDLTWSTRALSGDPAVALGGLADTIGAAMIVVGTREATVRATLGEFFNGSVAVHLAHRQHRPVVVIPLAPVPRDAALPWDES